MRYNNLSLYIHIPFCIRKCDYCDFLSAPADSFVRKKYVAALVREIRQWGERYNDRNVVSVFIGGGTPSLLDNEDLLQIMEAVAVSFKLNASAEITIECNPGTVNYDKLKHFRELRINRLSFGLQSANPHELKMLGRIHSYMEFEKNYYYAREAGFDNINVDLMSALPGQTIESLMNSVETVLKLKPEHISCYSLILEEGTPFYDRYQEADLPDDVADRDMYYAVRASLKSNGFHQYEISNYALNNYECIHNKVYWERNNYLGMGIGSASMIDNIRWKNIDSLAKYIDYYLADTSKGDDNCNSIIEAVEELDVATQMSEFMFLGLRKTEGVSLNEFEALYGRPLSCIFGDWNVKMIELGLLEMCDDRLMLTYKGMDLANYVMSGYV